MRKLLAGLAFTAAMWAGNASAAVVYELHIAGTLSFSSTYGDLGPEALAYFGSDPIQFDMRLGFDHGIEQGSFATYPGTLIAGSLNGVEFQTIGPAMAEAVDILSGSYQFSTHASNGSTTLAFNLVGTRPAHDTLGLPLTLTEFGSFDIAAFVTLADLGSGRQGSAFYTGSPTISAFSITGRSPGATPVPEPMSWAMMVAGFGIVGSALRRQRLAILSRTA